MRSMRRALLAGLFAVVVGLGASGCQTQANDDDGEPTGGTGGGAGDAGNGGSAGNGGASGGAGGGGGGTGGSHGELPDPMWMPEGTPTTVGDVSFVVPAGMTARAVVEGFEMSRQTTSSSGTRSCLLLVTPARAKVGDLATQAVQVMTEFFEAQGISLADERGGTDLFSYRAHGVSPRGWDYVELTAELRPGAPSLARGKLLLVNWGTSVVPVFGVSSDYYGCIRFDYERNVGQPDGPQTDWQSLYYSLQFSGATSNATALQEKLIGKWSDFTGGALIGEIYGANARYASSRTWVREREISPTEIERTTSTFSGEGSYVAEGETLARFPDDDAGEAVLFRLVERYAPPDTVGPGETNPRDELYQMKSGPLPGGARGAYELGLVRVPD
jgi:hypothetical protein